MQSLKRYIAQAIQCSDTPFDALVFFGSLRDAYSGRYLHEGWVQTGSAEEMHSALRETHQWLFNSILKASLPEMSRQLRTHFQSLNQPERETCAWWLEFEPFRDLIPQSCSILVRELFLSKIRAALEVLYRAPDWSELVVPAASPLQPLDQSLLLQWLS